MVKLSWVINIFFGSGFMKIEIIDKDRKNKYRRFKKYINDKKVILDTDSRNDLEGAFVKAFNEKDLRKRYIFIYDYMCSYVEKNILKFKSVPKNYLLLDYFFNKKQKALLQRSYGVPRSETIVKLLEL